MNKIKVLENRKGSVKINRDLLLEGNLNVLKAIFSKFYPLHIDTNLFSNNTTYYGISKEFDILEEGTVSPEYDCLITVNKNKTVSVKFNKLTYPFI